MKGNARTLRLKNNVNYLRQPSYIVHTVNEEVIKKNVPHQDNLSLSRSRSSQSKMTIQKNESTHPKKDDRSDNYDRSQRLPSSFK